LSSCGDGHRHLHRCNRSLWVVGVGRRCDLGMRGLGPERRLGGWDRWGQLVGAWELEVGFEVLNRWWFGDMVVAVVVVEAVGGRSWDLVARRGVGAVLGGSDLVDSMVGLSRFPGDIFLL